MNHAKLLVGAILVIGVWGTLSARAQSIDAVLDQAEEALGGQSVLGNLQAVRFESHGMWEMPSRGIPPTPFQVETVFSRPNRIRILWHFPEELGGAFTFGYDGQDAWGIWGAPPARCLGWHREVILHMAAELQLFLLAPARAEHGDTFELEALDAGEQAPLTKVVYRPLGADKPWTVWFVTNVGDLVRLEHDSYHMDGQPILARITRSMPKDFDGLKYPSQAKFEAIRDGQVLEIAEETIDSIELNPDLPPDYFACPDWEIDVATIGTKDVPAQTVVKFEYRGPYSEIGKALGPGMDVILASGLVPLEAVSGTYLDDPATTAPQDLRTEIAVRVAKIKEGEPELPSGYVLTTQPARRVAYAYHRGDYVGEAEAHQRLRAWMADQGLQAAGPPCGIWFHDPELTATEDLITEVQIPVQ